MVIKLTPIYTICWYAFRPSSLEFFCVIVDFQISYIQLKVSSIRYVITKLSLISDFPQVYAILELGHFLGYSITSIQYVWNNYTILIMYFRGIWGIIQIWVYSLYVCYGKPLTYFFHPEGMGFKIMLSRAIFFCNKNEWNMKTLCKYWL